MPRHDQARIFRRSSHLQPRRLPMPSLPSRALLPVGLCVGIISGCTHSSGSSRTSPAQTATVTSEDIQRTPGEPIERVLMGRYPGVTVTRTADGGLAVRIRGTTSILGSNAPLYVIDGIPIQPGPNGSLTGISPEDIESIQVLKDPAETAFYGGGGGHGGIVLKLKRPGQWRGSCCAPGRPRPATRPPPRRPPLA